MGKKLLAILLFCLALLPAGADTTLDAQVKVWLDHDYSNDTAIGNPRDQIQIRAEQEYDQGTSSTTAEADILWYGQRSLASGATEDIDLHGGITDVFGNTVSFARIKTLFAQNISTSQTLTIGGASAPFSGPLSPATATYLIGKSGVMLWQSPLLGYVVSSGTADTLRVTNSSGATATYNLWIVGASE